MHKRTSIVRTLTFVGLVGLASCGSCNGLGGITCTLLDCYEAAEGLCEHCTDLGKTAYECTYQPNDWYTDAQGIVQTYHPPMRYTDCFGSLAEAETACMASCNSPQWEGGCFGVQSVVAFDCTGESYCGPISGNDEAGDEAGGNAMEPSCEGWFLPDGVAQDPASGVYQVSQGFWLDMMADPRVVDVCDASWVEVDASGAAIVHDALPGTLAHAAGLVDGDVVLSVGGWPIAPTVDLEAAYWDLRYASGLDIVVQRGRATVTLVYEIQ
jgi:hypothetical protein